MTFISSLAGVWCLLAGAPLAAQNIITTIAGTDWLFPADGRRAVEAPLGAAGLFVAAEPQGGFFIADADSLTVMRVGTEGILQVIAGTGIPVHTGDGGPAIQAGIAVPTGIATDGRGSVLLAFADRIRKIDPNGIITTIAGNGTSGYSGDNGQAALAQFDDISAIAVDSAGAILVADSRNGRVRRVSASGVVTTLASGLNSPAGVAADRSGNVYFTESATDQSGVLRVITPGGSISNAATLGRPGTLAAEAGGAIFVSDPGRSSVYRYAPQYYSLTLVAGAGSSSGAGFSGDGGPATSARLDQDAGGIAVNAIGELFAGDSLNGRVRKVASNGIITTVAGNGAFRESGDANPASAATIYQPTGLAADPAGNLYITEPFRNRVRKIAPNGAITVVAGTGLAGSTGDAGPAVSATLSGPLAVAFDGPRGVLYVADTLNSRIRRIVPGGRIETAFQEGLSRPQGIAVDGAGNLYISDTENHRIRRVAPDGAFEVIAGTGTRGFGGDGRAATSALLDRPTGIAVDAAGRTVWFSDSGNGRVRRILNGVITTAADLLNSPGGVAAGGDGAVYVSDTGGERVRRIDASGVRTVAGTGTAGYSGDGGPAEDATLHSPSGLVFDTAGALLIADRLNYRIRKILTEAPSLTVAPSTVSFSIPPGGEDPGPQSFFVFSTVPGVAFTVAAGSPWLTVEPDSAATPATVSLRVDPSRLTGADNTASVTISSPLAANRQTAITVTASQLLGEAPGLRIDSGPLSYALFQGGQASVRTIVVSNASNDPISFKATGQTKLGWLKVTPASGDIPPQGEAGLQVTADPSVLSVATYTGSVVVTEVGDADVRTLPVTATVSQASQSVFLTHAGLTFTAVAKGAATPPQSVGVINLGGGNMAWTASVAGIAGSASWLAVSPARGSSGPSGGVPGSFTVSVDPAGLAAGDYYGQVQVAAPDADNSPQILLVVFTVLPAGSTPTPIPNPSSLIFNAAFGGPSPGAQTASVYNIASRAFTYASGRSTVSGGRWLQTLPSAGAIGSGGQARIVVQPVSDGLAPGVYRGAVTLQFDDGGARNIRIVLIVSGTGPSPRKASVPNAGACTPTVLVPVFTSLAPEIAVPAGWPQRLLVRVADDCGNPVSAGAVSAQFSTNVPPLNLVSLNDGNWAGTWQTRDTAPVTIKVKAELPGQNLRGTAQITTAVTANATPPLLDAVPVTDAASFVPGTPLAPGMLVRISGSRLAESSATASLPLPTQLAGATVAIAGSALPLIQAAGNRIDAVVPFDIPVNARLQLIVQRSGAAAAPQDITVSPAQPALFSRDGSGTGQGDISQVTAGGTLTLADTSSPVTAGDTIAIRCTGLGAVDGDSKVVTPVAVTVGGVNADIVSAVALPDTPGVYIIQATVGQGTPAGDAVEVVATSSKRSSAPVTIAVR